MKLRLMMIYGMKLGIYLGFIAETHDDWKLEAPFLNGFFFFEDTFPQLWLLIFGRISHGVVVFFPPRTYCTTGGFCFQD